MKFRRANVNGHEMVEMLKTDENGRYYAELYKVLTDGALYFVAKYQLTEHMIDVFNKEAEEI